MPKTDDRVDDYFFFRFVVFFAVFFVAAFVFRFFAIAALLAMSGWRHTVQSRIDVHCHPITTAGKK
jgi:hypothetical protein